MPALDQVLAMRPANVAARLGESRLPLLGALDLLRAVEARPAALATLPAIGAFALPALFHAARESDAVLGVSVVPGEDRRAPPRLFEAVRAAAEEGRHRLPFFLQAGPFVATSDDDRALALLGRSVFDHVEAGFTLISLDVRPLAAERRAPVATELARAAIERELAVEIAVDGDPIEATGFLGQLHAAGLAPAFARVSSSAFVQPDGELDFARAGAFASAIGAAHARPSLELRGKFRARTHSAFVASGFRKIEAGEELAERVRAKLGEGQERGEASWPMWRRLAEAREAIDGLDAPTRDKLEAFAFGEATELLAACGLEGSGRAAVALLASTGPA